MEQTLWDLIATQTAPKIIRLKVERKFFWQPTGKRKPFLRQAEKLLCDAC